MGMKPRTRPSNGTLDPVLQAKAIEAVEGAACYLQEETKIGDEYRFTDAEALAIIRRTARNMKALP